MEPQLPFEATIVRALWGKDTESLPRWKAWPIVVLRVVFAVARDVLAGNLTLHAMSLVYTTLLSFVPLLALSFSVLKGFGVHNQVEPILLRLLEPLGEKGQEIAALVIGFVDNIKVGVLGAVGLALLFYTVVSLMQKIESAFNDTWRISETRPLARRFSDYLSVLLIGPVLIFSAVGITASLTSNALFESLTAVEPLGTLIEIAGGLTPFLLVGGAFTFIYIFMPNTRVRLRSALLGGFVAGILWVTAGWGFATFVANSGNYAAIYSAFATLILFLIWLYLNWLILLVGSSICFLPPASRVSCSIPRPVVAEQPHTRKNGSSGHRDHRQKPLPGSAPMDDRAIDETAEHAERSGRTGDSGFGAGRPVGKNVRRSDLLPSRPPLRCRHGQRRSRRDTANW